MADTLSRDEARSFYDRFGKKQDSQGWYEDRATRVLISHGDFGAARAVVEFGCGTGRYAERLLKHHLGPSARYLGLDSSSTMIALAGERLRPWADRVEIRHTDGAPHIDAPDGSFDRFVSNYVFDLLSTEDIRAVLSEAHRVLADDGLLCTAGLTRGPATAQKVVMGVWTRVHRLSPRLVGGCRPIDLLSLLGSGQWRVGHHEIVSVLGITSECLVAAPLRGEENAR